MKKLLIITLSVFATVALMPSLAQAQKGNPLKNIPVIDMTGVLQNAMISIDDFSVEGSEIMVTSTLTGTVGGQQIEPQTVTYPIGIVASNCDQLVLLPGVIVSAEDFQIANFAVNISPQDLKEKQLSKALCAIAELHNTGGSPHVIVARIKQAVRAIL